MKHVYVKETRLKILTAFLTPPWFDFSSCILACKSVLPQTTAKQVFIPIRHTQVIDTVLKEGLWVHSGMASTKRSRRSKHHATDIIRCKFSFHSRVGRWTELPFFRAVRSRWWKWPWSCKDGNLICEVAIWAAVVICFDSTYDSTQATHLFMGSRNHYLYQVRASISDNNPSVYNNTSQQAKMKYCHVI